MANKKQDIENASCSAVDKPTVLLSVQASENRRLLQNFLPDYLTVKVSNNGISHHPFDICILDSPSFEKNKQALKTLKDETAPIFLPFLLLSQNRQAVIHNTTVLEFADDVVYVPTSTKLLELRINMLLKQREYSRKLEKKNQQLEKKNKELAEEKRKYKLITENSTDMISRHDPDGTYLYASPASKELTGYTPGELAGQNAFDNMHPEDRKVLIEENNPFTNKSMVRWTFRKQNKNGEYKWVESVMKPIRDEETGVLLEIQASTRDISARKKYERQLEEEKEFIDKSIQSLPELFFLIDEDQNFIKWNNIERELGYSDEELPKMSPLDFYREEDHSFITSKINEAFENGNAEAEVQMKAKNGEIIPFFVTANLFTRGEKEFIVGSCINLTEIKVAQFELEKQRQLLDAIINQTESLIYLKDNERKYRLVNDSYLEFYGLERSDVIGKTDREVHGEEFARQIGETDYKVLKLKKASDYEETRSSNGKSSLYHTIKYPLSGVPGFENCMCGISTDITDLKQASRQLQERIKEQSCLYNISSLPSQINTVDELLERAVQLIPDGWQYPEITEVAITYGDKAYQSENYRDSPWQLSTNSSQNEEIPLQVKVVYIEEKERIDEGPFMHEERQLIESIAETISSQIDQIISDEKLKESRKRWKSLVKNDPNLIQILESDGTIQFINQAGAKILGFENPENVVGKNYFDLIELERDAAKLAKERTQQVVDGHEIESHTFKITDSNGNLLYLESQAVPITLDDGRIGLQQVAKDITERIEYEQELEKSLQEKKTLLQEIHHRVKNNLAVVSGMMELQTFITENQEVKDLLNDSKSRIQTMALIHEKLYQSKSLSHIDFGAYVEDLIENIKKVTPKSDSIQIELEYDHFNLNVNQAVPCALIINEVVSNSFEHAFTDRQEGDIKVSLEEQGELITVTVDDNGQGLPANYNERTKESMGVTIIKTLIRQLQADHEIKSEDGLTFIFSFERQEIKGSSSALV